MSLFRMRFAGDGSIHSWKLYAPNLGWRQTTHPIFGLDHDNKDFDIRTHGIIFDAHHWSSILNGLVGLGNRGRLRFPSNRVVCAHQYWVSKRRQVHDVKMSMHPSAAAYNEKLHHRHKVLLYNSENSTQLGPKAASTQLFSQQAQSFMTAPAFARVLQGHESKIGKAPNVGGDVRDDIFGLAATVAEFFTG